MTKFTEFLLDALTGRPAKGFTPAELAREHQAQMIGVIGGVISSRRCALSSTAAHTSSNTSLPTEASS